MATKKHSKSVRAKARKLARRPKTPQTVSIEGWDYDAVKGGVMIDGHHFDKKRMEELRKKVAERFWIAQQRHMGSPQNYAHDVGLADVLHKHRPRARAKDRLLDLSWSLTEVATAISSMRDYSFTSQGAPGNEGARMLRRLVTEAHTRLKRIEHFANSLELEERTKLQDWIAREEEFQRIGKETQA